ncbi:Ras-like GTP-binding protein RhoL, partial [Pseudolycoriella hygida]
ITSIDGIREDNKYVGHNRHTSLYIRKHVRQKVNNILCVRYSEMDKFLNLVIIGEPMVGKTSLFRSYKKQCSDCKTHSPTVYDIQESELVLDGVRRSIRLYDTGGQEDYDRLRILTYNLADVFILCFSMNCRSALLHICRRWYYQLLPYPSKPIILVGTKCDVQGPDTVDVDEAKAVAKKIRANRFLMCSAKDFYNINEVIYAAVRSMDPKKDEESPKSFAKIRKFFNRKSE